MSIPDVVHEFDWSGMSVVKLPWCAQIECHVVLKNVGVGRARESNSWVAPFRLGILLFY